MKKLVLLLIIIIPLSFLHSKEISILIINFKNVTNDPQYDFIRGNISDALFAKLNSSKKFNPTLFSNKKTDIEIKNLPEIMRFALKEQYDIIIDGYYYIEDDNIKIHFTVEDVLTGRSKISYKAEGEVGIQIYSLIKTSAETLAIKMDKQIETYPDDFILKQRKKRESQISEKKTEMLFLLETGIYIPTPFKILINGAKTFDLTYFTGGSYFNFHFLWETPNKKDYLGFGLFFNAPFVDMVVNRTAIAPSLSLSYAYAKTFFFDFSFNFLFINESYELENENNNSIQLSTLSFGSGFNFKYMPPNKRYAFSVGISFPFSIPVTNTQHDAFTSYNNDDENDPILFNTTSITTESYDTSTDHSDGRYTFFTGSFTPAVLHLSASFYPNKNLGVSINAQFSLTYIDGIKATTLVGSTMVNPFNYGQYLEFKMTWYVAFTFRDTYIINRVAKQ